VSRRVVVVATCNDGEPPRLVRALCECTHTHTHTHTSRNRAAAFSNLIDRVTLSFGMRCVCVRACARARAPDLELAQQRHDAATLNDNVKTNIRDDPLSALGAPEGPARGHGVHGIHGERANQAAQPEAHAEIRPLSGARGAQSVGLGEAIRLMAVVRAGVYAFASQFSRRGGSSSWPDTNIIITITIIVVVALSFASSTAYKGSPVLALILPR
jgi:hypothetical protein